MQATLDIQALSLYKLKILRKRISAEIKFREKSWRKSHRLYGTMNKGFTPEELRLFLSCVKTDKYWVLFSLQALTGLRIHEVCKLRWENIDWDNARMYVHSDKTNRTDEIPISTDAINLLAWWKDKNNGNEFVFAGERNPHVSRELACTRFREAADRAGLTMTYCRDSRGNKRHRLSTHSLRHFFVTTVHRRTKDVKVAQRLARHVNGKQTLEYIHPTEQELRAAVEISLDI